MKSNRLGKRAAPSKHKVQCSDLKQNSLLKILFCMCVFAVEVFVSSFYILFKWTQIGLA